MGYQRRVHGELELDREPSETQVEQDITKTTVSSQQPSQSVLAKRERKT